MLGQTAKEVQIDSDSSCNKTSEKTNVSEFKLLKAHGTGTFMAQLVKIVKF